MQMRSLTKTPARALGAALLALTSAVPATAGLIVNTRSSILYHDGTQLYDAASLNTYDGTLTPGEIVQSQGIVGGTDPQRAIASARADYGSLGVLTDVSVSNVTPLNPNDPSPNYSRSRQVVAQAWNSWEDSVSFVKAGAPSGTLVDVRVNLVVDIENVSALIDSFALTVASFDFSAHGRTWCLRANSPGYDCPAGMLGLQVGHNEISFDLQVLTGMSYNWGAYMHAESLVESYSWTDPFNSIASVHAMNTAHSYYTVLTAETSMLSLSGHDYALPSSVPEPASYATVLVGLGLIGVQLRRRARGAA
ncbi:MAG: PEP-CTERM sorting domain-containing protein [Rubrivivax sp.]|nr:PEP-CTERM sorting domain-containing protein [Rubrivivax sp.]